MACANMQLLPRVCFFFLTLSGLTFGDRSGPGVTVVVSEGDDAILPCSLSTKESVVQKLFDWKKVDQKIKEVFLYDAGVHYNNGLPGQDEQFKGRVSHFSDQLQFGNASIIIRNTILADSGDYTCEFPDLQSEEITNIKLVVEGRLKVRNIPGAAQPSVTTLKETDDWAQLQCDVRGANPKPTVEWRDSDGQIISSEEPQVSERGGSFNITLITTVKKSDRYRCVATQEEINHQTYKEINVYLSARPCVTNVDQTDDWAQLQCDVRGANPKPTVEWRDSDGQIISSEEPQVSERGDGFDITLITTVKKSDRYRCVATQEEIHHRTYKEINVYLSDAASGSVMIRATIVSVIVGIIVAV